MSTGKCCPVGTGTPDDCTPTSSGMCTTAAFASGVQGATGICKWNAGITACPQRAVCSTMTTSQCGTGYIPDPTSTALCAGTPCTTDDKATCCKKSLSASCSAMNAADCGTGMILNNSASQTSSCAGPKCTSDDSSTCCISAPAPDFWDSIKNFFESTTGIIILVVIGVIILLIIIWAVMGKNQSQIAGGRKKFNYL